jgi:hypothetical protein
VVFVLDRYKRPLMPCSEKRARLLLHGNEDAAPSSPRLKPGASGAAKGR